MHGALNDARVPRVLAIVDRPGWAIDRKARNLQRVLAGRYDIVVRYQHEVNEGDIEGADLVLVFYWLEVGKMNQLAIAALERCADRLMIGICGHAELEGDRREPGLALLNRLPRAVFANSRLLEREFAPLLRVPVHYTPNGVDTTFFCPASPPRARPTGTLQVGWAGSLVNHGTALRGFDDVIQPAVAAVRGVTLSTAIREQHWRNADEMLEFYRDLDVYVCASRSEGTPNPCLEAAACGLPVVTTAVGNMPEFIVEGENGLFHDGTVPDLSEKLARLRDSPALLCRMSVRARDIATSWDWCVQAENYARAFLSSANFPSQKGRSEFAPR